MRLWCNLQWSTLRRYKTRHPALHCSHPGEYAPLPADASLDPVSKAYTVDSYPETQFVTAIALRKNKQDVGGCVCSVQPYPSTQHERARRLLRRRPPPTSLPLICYITLDSSPRRSSSQLIGLTQHAVAVLPVSTPSHSSGASLDTTPSNVRRTEQKIGKIIAQPVVDIAAESIEMRFNDGGADPAGRLFAGSTNHTMGEGTGFRGDFWRCVGRALKLMPSGYKGAVFARSTERMARADGS